MAMESTISKIWLAGYTGRKPIELLQLSTELDAPIVDIRFSDRSMHPTLWAGYALRQVLGGNYEHVRELGNVNYKVGGIKISDMETGIRKVLEIGMDVILLCGCKDGAVCHRSVVGEAFRERGHEVAEVDWSVISPQSQLGLF